MYEIRNYHYDPGQFDAYRRWAVAEAIPFLRANLDLIGFWMDQAEPTEIEGSDPMELRHGSANVTWIIRWDSLAARNQFQLDVFDAAEWQSIWANHPDPDGYLHMEARFANEYGVYGF